MLLTVLISNENGAPLYSKSFIDQNIDETLVIAFFSALKMFAQAFLHDNSNIKAIHIGNVLLDFDNVNFEEIDPLDVIIISQGMDATSSKALVTEITEQFAIFFDQKRIENPNIISMMRQGKFPSFRGFDPILEEVVQNFHRPNLVQLDVRWDIPEKIANLVKEMFKINPCMAELYDNNITTFLEQVLHEYTVTSLEKDLRHHFKNGIQKKSN
jgi:hypothetical protein